MRRGRRERLECSRVSSFRSQALSTLYKRDRLPVGGKHPPGQDDESQQRNRQPPSMYHSTTALSLLACLLQDGVHQRWHNNEGAGIYNPDRHADISLAAQISASTCSSQRLIAGAPI
jgi:hypothetical protein